MIGHKLPNKNEKCYSSRTQTFSPTKQPLLWRAQMPIAQPPTSASADDRPGRIYMRR
jgi:hypothetical protein